MLNDGMATPYSEAQQAIQPATSSTSELDHVPTAAQPTASTSGFQQQQQEQKEPRSARSYDSYEEAEQSRRLSSGRRQSSSGYSNAQNHEYPAHPYISQDQDVNMDQSGSGLPPQQVYEAVEQPQAQSQYASTSQPPAAPPPHPAILQPQQPSSIKQSSQQQQPQSQMQQMHGQPHQYDASTGIRTTSDNFGSVRAGPPSPGKMDLLPWGSSNEASSSHHDRKYTSGSTSHGRPGSSSGPRIAPNTTNAHGQSAQHSSSSSRHHKSRSQATSNTIPGGMTKPSGIPPAFTAQQQQQNAYHEPVAPSSGRSANSKGSSTTSEFTKRKNWSQRIVEEMQDILHVLSPSGTLLFVSPSVTDLTGHTPEEMVGHSITEFMEGQDVESFLEEFRFAIMNEQTLTTYYRMRRKPGTSSSAVTGLPKEEMLDGEDGVTEQPPAEEENDVAMAGTPADEATILFEVTGQPYYTSAPPKSSARRRAADESRMGADSDSDDSNVNELAEDGDDESGESGSGLGAKLCKCFFAMARPYPSKNNATLDTFLELKIENEKLRKKLGDIYREIEGDQSEEEVSPPTATSFQTKTGRPPAYFHGDPTQFELGEAPGERAISGFPSRMSGVFAQQQAQARARDSKPSDQGGNERGGNHQGSPPNSAVPPGIVARGGPVDQGDGLVSSAGLIPSTSNTYGALGIGISQHARQGNASGAGGNSLSTSKGAGDAAAGDGGADDKKKKPKKQRTEEGEFVCRDCGTVDSPEWRRGPLGPKTLCNACGLRWAKKNKQTQRNSLGGAENLAAAK